MDSGGIRQKLRFPTEGLSAAFAYKTEKTRLRVILVEFPNAHLDHFVCNIRKVEQAADLLEGILRSGREPAARYTFTVDVLAAA